MHDNELQVDLFFSITYKAVRNDLTEYSNKKHSSV